MTISGIDFFAISLRQLAPGTLLIAVLMPIWPRLSCTSTAIGSQMSPAPRSKEIVVSMPDTPLSAISALALAMSFA